MMYAFYSKLSKELKINKLINLSTPSSSWLVDQKQYFDYFDPQLKSLLEFNAILEFLGQFALTLVLLRVFPKHIFLRGVVATPLWIINTEGHITLNLLHVYRYGHPLSIDTKISTNH